MSFFFPIECLFILQFRVPRSMPSQEDVEEINTYLQQHTQKQAEKGIEKKNLLTGLQRALFGETHADYSPASTPRATTIPLTPTSPVSPPVPAVAPAAKPTVLPASVVKEKNTMEISPTPIAVAPPSQMAAPKTETPIPDSRMHYKSDEETETTPLSPPPARFNPYPNPYRKAVPSPPTFSDSTAPPWVMRTLPAESRDVRKESNAASAPGIADSNLKSAPVQTAVPLKKEIQSFTTPAPTNTSVMGKDTRSTRAKMMELVHETNGKEGNDSPHRMPWHADASGEVTPNELVGLAPAPVPVRAPISPVAPSPSAVERTPSPAALLPGLNSQEHDYLLRKEQEYDRAHARSGNPAATASPSITSPTPNTENASIDEKKAILGRLKELMAQHQGTPL